MRDKDLTDNTTVLLLVKRNCTLTCRCVIESYVCPVWRTVPSGISQPLIGDQFIVDGHSRGHSRAFIGFDTILVLMLFMGASNSSSSLEIVHNRCDSHSCYRPNRKHLATHIWITTHHSRTTALKESFIETTPTCPFSMSLTICHNLANLLALFFPYKTVPNFLCPISL